MLGLFLSVVMRVKRQLRSYNERKEMRKLNLKIEYYNGRFDASNDILIELNTKNLE